MGVEPYLVASSLEAVLAQRLVRLVCSSCKQQYRPAEPESLEAAFGPEVPPELYRGRGCRECRGTGYRERTGVFELMPVWEEVRRLILRRASAGDIRAQALREGMLSLRQDGWRHVLAGRTTVEEVLRVTKDERLHANGLLGSEGDSP
jgi:type II secretory ATPase GspE/PulE/Tfp pilus assembly ATPase PilB-like protein